MSTTCKSCGAPIRWARTAGSGKPIPLNEARTVVLRELPGQTAGDGTPIVETVVGHQSHFATCPQAAEHRRPR